MNDFWQQNSRLVLFSVILILLIALSYGGYRYFALSDELAAVRQEMASTTQELESEISELEDRNLALEGEREELSENLEEERERVEEFDERIAEVTEGVGTLQKTIATDPELLRKYSRVYFLSENYTPSELVEIDDEYSYGDESRSIHAKVDPYLEDLLEDAADDGIELQIISAFRSFGTQRVLNDNYTFQYGAGTANQFSAEQGYSEHQLGTTIDFTTPQSGGNFGAFDSTEAFDWLTENAWRYGFVLSYPEGNEYYQYEPWHWRFVGEELAEDLHEDDAHFYDWSQREIDMYRSELFE